MTRNKKITLLMLFIAIQVLITLSKTIACNNKCEPCCKACKSPCKKCCDDCNSKCEICYQGEHGICRKAIILIQWITTIKKLLQETLRLKFSENLFKEVLVYHKIFNKINISYSQSLKTSEKRNKGSFSK